MSFIQHAGTGLSVAILIGGLVLPYVGGYPLAYSLIIASLLLSVSLLPARIAPVLEPTGWTLAAALALLAVAFAVNDDLPFAANFAMFAIFAPLATALSRGAGPDNAGHVARLALLGSALATAIAASQVFVLGYGRAAGFGSDPIWSAQIAVILGFLALVGLPQATGMWRLLFRLGPVLGMSTALLAGSRGPLLAAPAMLAMALLFTRRWTATLPIIVATGALAVVLVGAIYPDALMRLATLATIGGELAAGTEVTEVSSGQRLALYQSGISAFLAQPVFGHGWEGKIAAIVPYLEDGGAMLAEGHHHLHSDILDLAVSGGVFGLVAYALAIVAPVAGALASPRDSQYRSRLLGTALLATGYLVCGLTYLMFGYEFHTTLYVCLAAILIGYCRDAPMSAPKAPA